MSTRNTLVGGFVALVVAGASFGGGIALAGSGKSGPVGGVAPGASAAMGMGETMRGHGGGMSMQVADEFEWMATMIPHHEEAIVAAEVLKQGTDRPEMRAFADRIITTQTREVVQLKAWLAAWYPGRDADVDYQPMMRDLTGVTGDALDRAFLQDMIPHHMGAVMMSQQLLSDDLATHAEVVPFARTIRDAQHAEIREMSEWLAAWFGESGMGRMAGMGGMGGMALHR